MNSSDSPSTSRRQFIKTSTATAAGFLAAPAILGTKSSAASPGDTLRVGLIGCGGRGSEAAMNAMRGDKNAVLTAMADIYEENIENKLPHRCVCQSEADGPASRPVVRNDG